MHELWWKESMTAGLLLQNWVCIDRNRTTGHLTEHTGKLRLGKGGFFSNRAGTLGIILYWPVPLFIRQCCNQPKRWSARFSCKSHVAYFHFRIYLIFPLNKIHVTMKTSLHFSFSITPWSHTQFSIHHSVPHGLSSLMMSPLLNSVPIINETLISKRTDPKGSPSCKTKN